MAERRRQLLRILRSLRDADALDTLDYLHRTALDAELLAQCKYYVRYQVNHELALLLDNRQRILAASDGWCALHGVPCLHAIGRCLWDFDHQQRQERRRRLIESAVLLGETICTREPEVHGRGELWFVVHPLSSRQGGRLGCMILGTHIPQPTRKRTFFELTADGQWQVIR